ncbi:polyprenyl synthetase family protein [Pelagibius sp.]|uniref:polyprenyl synthetase family protein n=1 Tax=Pelagibius sp. TaxID=1931238 RepID=UPI002626634C|nr:polyprenyl synthetase family protein [Pelagibius sp.]
MKTVNRVDAVLDAALLAGEAPGHPPRLAAAMRHAVFPGGARIRPQLCLAVASACGEGASDIAAASAAAIELLHCASLVHDDLPCFDDADLRRGKPAVHKAFDERLAVLAGDALIVMAFEVLGRGAAAQPQRLSALLRIVGAAVGTPHGISAGQAWECEPALDLAQYQRAKTGALFAGATMAGAAAAGYEPAPWRPLGEGLGEAYQVADDIRDVFGNPDELGKPVGQDAAHQRPNAVHALGLDGAIDRLEALVAAAAESIPLCPGRRALRLRIIEEAQRFLPKKLRRAA